MQKVNREIPICLANVHEPHVAGFYAAMLTVCSKLHALEGKLHDKSTDVVKEITTPFNFIYQDWLEEHFDCMLSHHDLDVVNVHSGFNFAQIGFDTGLDIRVQNEPLTSKLSGQTMNEPYYNPPPFDTLTKIVEQLEYCEYFTKDQLHSLTMNEAFVSLKKMAEAEAREAALAIEPDWMKKAPDIDIESYPANIGDCQSPPARTLFPTKIEMDVTESRKMEVIKRIDSVCLGLTKIMNLAGIRGEVVLRPRHDD
jgi:hypothetical protein